MAHNRITRRTAERLCRAAFEYEGLAAAFRYEGFASYAQSLQGISSQIGELGRKLEAHFNEPNRGIL